MDVQVEYMLMDLLSEAKNYIYPVKDEVELGQFEAWRKARTRDLAVWEGKVAMLLKSYY